MFSKKDLTRLIIPLMIEQLLGLSVGIIDTMMISSLGEAAVSGVSLVDMLNGLMMNIFAALATGSAVICSHEIGRVKAEGGPLVYPRARDAARQLLAVLFCVSFLLAGAAALGRVGLLRLCFGSIEADAMEHALVYFVISCAAFPFIALYSGLAALFRTMGNSRVTMRVSALINLVNIAGNAILIFGFDMGVAGAAVSTVFSRFLGMLILAVRIANKKLDLCINWRERFVPDFAVIRKILHLGVPGSLENSSFQFGRLIAISMISGMGTVQTAANAVANNLDSLGVVPGHAIQLAMITVVGQCLGAGRFDEALHYQKKLVRLTMLSHLILDTLIIVTLPLTLNLYTLSAETRRLAMLLVLIHDGFAIVLWPPSFVTPSAIRAAGDVRYAMTVSMTSIVLFRIGLTWVFGVQFGFGILGVMFATIADWIFRGSLFTWRIRSGRWLHALQREACTGQ